MFMEYFPPRTSVHTLCHALKVPTILSDLVFFLVLRQGLFLNYKQ